ncbi:MAG: hypothetical protein ACREKK_08755 [Candidatus Methylomirabilales bacterium]
MAETLQVDPAETRRVFFSTIVPGIREGAILRLVGRSSTVFREIPPETRVEVRELTDTGLWVRRLTKAGTWARRSSPEGIPPAWRIHLIELSGWTLEGFAR